MRNRVTAPGRSCSLSQRKTFQNICPNSFLFFFIMAPMEPAAFSSLVFFGPLSLLTGMNMMMK